MNKACSLCFKKQKKGKWKNKKHWSKIGCPDCQNLTSALHSLDGEVAPSAEKYFGENRIEKNAKQNILSKRMVLLRTIQCKQWRQRNPQVDSCRLDFCRFCHLVMKKPNLCSLVVSAAFASNVYQKTAWGHTFHFHPWMLTRLDNHCLLYSSRHLNKTGDPIELYTILHQPANLHSHRFGCFYTSAVRAVSVSNTVATASTTKAQPSKLLSLT